MNRQSSREQGMGRLRGRKVAILATDGFELSELVEPKKALEREGATAVVVSPREGDIQGYNHHDKADTVRVDVPLSRAKPTEFDALVLPGGALNPDELRVTRAAVEFVRGFASVGKPIAAICHGPWTLIEAGAAEGKTMTSWPSIRTDLENAGARWVDREVVVDHGLVTSRKPDDLPAFNEKMIEEFAEGRHTGTRSRRGIDPPSSERS